MLLSLILIPLLTGLLVAFAPAAQARRLAMTGSLIAVVACLGACAQFDWVKGGVFQLVSSMGWAETLGLKLSLGVDSVAMMLIALTVLLGPICVAASFTAITERPRTYYAWLMILQAAMTGVFASRDLVFFYICFEFTLIPMYVLISLYGSTNRKAAATKFFLYTFTGSVIALAGLVYIVWFNATQIGSGAFAGAATWTFDMSVLEHAARSMPKGTQAWVLGALLLGFAVKVPLFPFHTWLPLAHTEAPTAGSVILAGVLLKLGTYGIFRFALGYVPAAFIGHAPLIATFAIIGILYGGLICWVQTDVKKLVAYSSVAHLGFCILGLAAVNGPGVQGSVMYMINHGLSTGALFLLIGMIYERYHTRDMKQLGGLAKRMPIWATFMVFFVMASVGLPGLNGFVSEFLCLLGAFQSSNAWGAGLWGSFRGGTPGATAGVLGPWYAAIAGTGMIVAAIYLLYMVGKVVFGPLVEPHGHGGDAHGHGDKHAKHGADAAHAGTLPADLTLREILVLTPLAVLCIALGVYATPALKALEGPVNQTVSAAWTHAGGGGVKSANAAGAEVAR